MDLVDAYTTDPELRDTTQQFFVALRDDQNFFPRCCAATMATHHVLDAFSHVRLREALERLTGKVTKTTSPP